MTATHSILGDCLQHASQSEQYSTSINHTDVDDADFIHRELREKFVADANFKSTSISGSHGRAILTGGQAQAIFGFRPQALSIHRDRASTLSRMYGVSVKTVRDIWKGRTWYRETYHLDPSKAPMIDRLMKKAGRPKGVKDSKPRAKKEASDEYIFGISSETVTTADPGICNRDCTSYSLDTWNGVKQELLGDTPCSDAHSALLQDPFHDDWAYWPEEFQVGAQLGGGPETDLQFKLSD